MATDLTAQITKQLEADGNQVTTVQLNCGQVIVGYQGKFSMNWFATKLHLFTVVLQADKADAPLLQQLTDEAIEYAKQQKGTFRGLQTGLAVIPAIIAKQASEDVLQAVQQRPPKMFALMLFPLIITSSKLYTYTGNIIVGTVYAPWIRQRTQAVFDQLVKS